MTLFSVMDPLVGVERSEESVRESSKSGASWFDVMLKGEEDEKEK